MASTTAATKATNSSQARDTDACDEGHVDHGLLDHLKEYAREKPEVAALWCLGIGFILGWKLKPW